MTVELPLLVVETDHSRYVIDQNKGVYTRTRVHEHAADLDGWDIPDGKPRPYQDILSNLVVGDRVVITHAEETFVHSTPIRSVREVPAAQYYAEAA